MAWTYDEQKVQRHMDEAREFLDHVRNSDEPAGWSDLFGRPFRAPNSDPQSSSVPIVSPQPVQPVQVNVYILQAKQLLEANLITREQYTEIVQRVHG